MASGRWVIINSERRRWEAIEQLRALKIEPGKIEEILIQPYQRQRSLRQNRLYQAWAKEIGDYLGLHHRQAKEVIQAEVLGYEVIQGMRGQITVPRGTSDMDTKEFSEFLDNVLAFAATLNITLFLPQDYGRITQGKATHE